MYVFNLTGNVFFTCSNVQYAFLMFNILQNAVDEGYAATQILSQLLDSIIEQDFNDAQKSVVAEKMAVSIFFLMLFLSTFKTIKLFWITTITNVSIFLCLHKHNPCTTTIQVAIIRVQADWWLHAVGALGLQTEAM